MFLEDTLRYAFRQMRKNPGFTAIAIATLALGIGVNTAVFSVIDAVLLRQPPYPAPDRLVTLRQNEPAIGDLHLNTSTAEFLDYRDRNRTFSSLAGFETLTLDMTGSGEPERVNAVRATANLFATLGVTPQAGRTFTDLEDHPGAAQVAVISDAFRRRRFPLADPRGSTIRLNEQLYTIIGVMPPGFQFPAGTTTAADVPSLWIPMAFSAEEIADRAASFDTAVVARRKPGVTLAQAQDDMNRVARQFQREHPDVYNGNVYIIPEVRPLGSEQTEKAGPILWTLAAAVAFVLLIACANVANLFLTRAAVRQRELAVRTALGARPAHLIGQLLTESLLLTLAGGAAGCLFALALTSAAARFWPEQVPGLGGVHVDLPLLLFTLTLSVLTGLVCGLAPVLHSIRPQLADALKQAGRHIGTTRSGQRLREALVVLEAASAVVLLVGAGLLIHSFLRVIRVSPGFQPDGALTVRTAFNHTRYADSTKRWNAERAILERLRPLPGVTQVALTTHLPLADERQIGFAIEGRDPNVFHWADNALVSPDYFRVMGIPLLAGRTFDERDAPDHPLSILINQSMAKLYWPGTSALGERVLWGGRPMTIIGIAGDVRLKALESAAAPTIYGDVFQAESGASASAIFVLRSAQPNGLANDVRQAIWSIDPGLPVFGTRSLEDIVARSVATRRFTMLVLALFAVMALLLAAIGLYGVLSYSVAQRTAEIGVRLALGAQPSAVWALVLRRGLALVATGLAAGALTSLALNGFLSKLLYGIEGTDPLVFLCVCAVLLIVAAAASFVPARRASRVDPMTALRAD